MSGGAAQGGCLTDEERTAQEASIVAAAAKADAVGRAAAARDDARAYADGLVSALTDGAPEALDT